MKAYLENWNIDEEFYNDDPMEIDEIKRPWKKEFIKNKFEKEKYNNNIKGKQKEVKKYCHICDKYIHSTKEYFYSLKIKNNKGFKKNYKKEFKNKFIDEINKTNIEESDDEGKDFTKLKIYTGNIDAIINEDIKVEEGEEEVEVKVEEEDDEDKDKKDKLEKNNKIKFEKEILEILKEYENKNWMMIQL